MPALWPGYYINKFEAIPDPIISEIPVFSIDPNLEPASETKTTAGTYYMFNVPPACAEIWIWQVVSKM